jgi:hypothetical protein
MASFTAAAFLFFGGQTTAFGSISQAWLTSLEMLMGVSNYNILTQGDDIFGQFCFYVFHMSFLVIMNFF